MSSVMLNLDPIFCWNVDHWSSSVPWEWEQWKLMKFICIIFNIYATVRVFEPYNIKLMVMSWKKVNFPLNSHQICRFGCNYMAWIVCYCLYTVFLNARVVLWFKSYFCDDHFYAFFSSCGHALTRVSVLDKTVGVMLQICILHRLFAYSCVLLQCCQMFLVGKGGQ